MKWIYIIVVEEPTTNVGWVNFKKNQVKDNKIIYDLVKDNLIFVIISLKTTNECFDTLTNLYEKKDLIQKRALKNKLWNLKMEKENNVASLFTNIS